MPSENLDTTTGTIDTTTEKQKKRRETANQKKATQTTHKTLENEIRTALNCIQGMSEDDSESSNGCEPSASLPIDRHPAPIQQQPYCGQEVPVPGYPPLPSYPLPHPLHPYYASKSTDWPQQPPPDVFLPTKIDKLTLLVENLTSRVEALENTKTSASAESNLFLGESLSLTAGQQATLKCLSASQEWPYTLRKLLAILYEDLELGQMCAVGKSGAKNMPMNREDLGALKGMY